MRCKLQPSIESQLADVQDPKEPEFNTLVRIMATRCMLAAEYFCSGSVSKDAYGHYGLASKIYTHFTVRPLHPILQHELTFSHPSGDMQMYSLIDNWLLPSTTRPSTLLCSLKRTSTRPLVWLTNDIGSLKWLDVLQ